MDKSEHNLKQRLRQDAAAIKADVPPELRARIDANLAPVEQRKQARRLSSWWLTLGVTAAGVVLLALVLMPRVDKSVEPDNSFAATPVYTTQQESPLSLNVQPVELTKPLQQELLSLQVDLQTVRESIAQELRSTL